MYFYNIISCYEICLKKKKICAKINFICRKEGNLACVTLELRLAEQSSSTQGFFFYSFCGRWKWEFCDLFYLAYSEVSLEHFGTVNTVMQYLRKVLVLLSKISSLSVKSIATILGIIGVNGAFHLIIFNDSWGLFYKPFKGGCFILNSSINFPNVGGYALWYIASLFEVMTSLTIDRKSDNFTQSTNRCSVSHFKLSLC